MRLRSIRRAGFAACAVLLFQVLSSASALSEEAFGVVTYDISFPLADLNDFIDEVSWRGFGLEARWLHMDKLSIGLSLNWNTFHMESSEMIEIENGHVSGYQYRVAYAVPIHATAHYYLRPPKDNPDFIPYVGLGIGTTWVERRIEIGVAVIEEDSWRFGLAPEAGFWVPVGYINYLTFSARYDYAFESSDEPAYSYWGVRVGIVATR
jgi:opacity protein-like surface antigen